MLHMCSLIYASSKLHDQDGLPETRFGNPFRGEQEADYPECLQSVAVESRRALAYALNINLFRGLSICWPIFRATYIPSSSLFCQQKAGRWNQKRQCLVYVYTR